MTGDVCRAITGKLPRKPDKRKKRKPRKKTNPAQKAETSTEIIANVPASSQAVLQASSVVPKSAENTPEPPKMNHNQANMSPRKQTLMRHKSGHGSADEPSFVSEVKEIKKNRKAPGQKPNVDAVDGKYSYMLANQPMDEKASLFVAPMSRIVSYHEKVHESPLRASPGTLLAHGEFEIFQLHNGDVTYLACGKTFVYPLLPKLKILRTSGSEFVLPLVNPQRYWKIHIESTDESVFSHLEAVLQNVVKYTNLAVSDQISANTAEGHENGAFLHAGHGKGPKTPVSKPTHYTPFFNDIPESPPSVPVSPQQVDLYKDISEISETNVSAPWETPSTPNKSVHSLTAAMASFGLPNGRDQQDKDRSRQKQTRQPLSNPFFQDQPVLSMASNSHIDTVHHNPGHAPQQAKSETSSMDSLLDEYEETISVTRSVQHHISRPPSRAASHISGARSIAHSTARSAAMNYHRPPILSSHDYDTSSGRKVANSQIDGFPTASLSRYERARQNSVGGRSRQSSVSELYSSTSNWMEPGQLPSTKKLASSKSTYSLVGNGQSGKQNLNDAYREIYRSITSHNLSQYSGNGANGGGSSSKSQTAESRTQKKSQNSQIPKIPQNSNQKPQMRSAGSAELYTRTHPAFNASKTHRSANAGGAASARVPHTDGLSSLEVFKLLSERDTCQSAPASGLRKLFGW